MYAFSPLLPIPVVLGGLHPLAAKLDCVGAGHIIDHFLLHVAVWCLHVGALVVILSGGVNLVSGVTHPVLPSETSLDLVGLLQGLIVDGLHQVTHQLVHVETDTLNISLDDPSAVPVRNCLTVFFVCSPASFLIVRLTFVHEDDLLYLVAIWVLIDTIASNIGLSYVRIIALCRTWCWVLGWRRCAEDKGKTGDSKEKV